VNSKNQKTENVYCKHFYVRSGCGTFWRESLQRHHVRSVFIIKRKHWWCVCPPTLITQKKKRKKKEKKGRKKKMEKMAADDLEFFASSPVEEEDEVILPYTTERIGHFAKTCTRDEIYSYLLGAACMRPQYPDFDVSGSILVSGNHLDTPLEHIVASFPNDLELYRLLATKLDLRFYFARSGLRENWFVPFVPLLGHAIYCGATLETVKVLVKELHFPCVDVDFQNNTTAAAAAATMDALMRGASIRDQCFMELETTSLQLAAFRHAKNNNSENDCSEIDAIMEFLLEKGARPRHAGKHSRSLWYNLVYVGCSTRLLEKMRTQEQAEGFQDPLRSSSHLTQLDRWRRYKPALSKCPAQQHLSLVDAFVMRLVELIREASGTENADVRSRVFAQISFVDVQRMFFWLVDRPTTKRSVVLTKYLVRYVEEFDDFIGRDFRDAMKDFARAQHSLSSTVVSDKKENIVAPRFDALVDRLNANVHELVQRCVRQRQAKLRCYEKKESRGEVVWKKKRHFKRPAPEPPSSDDENEEEKEEEEEEEEEGAKRACIA
jgi:hypothetical protein